MRKCLAATVVLMFLSSGAFATTKYWVGADNALWKDTANWSLTSGGAGGAALPGASDDVVFDSNSNATNIPNIWPSMSWAQTYPIINSVTFNRPGGYGITTIAGSFRGIKWCPTFNLQTADCYTIRDTFWQTSNYPSGILINTVAGSTLQLTGGEGCNYNTTGNPITLAGPGHFLYTGGKFYGSVTILDCGSVDLGVTYGGSALYNLTNLAQGNISVGVGGSWNFYSRGTARGTGYPSVSIGNYALARPVVFKSFPYMGSRTNGIFFNYNTYAGDNTTITGLKCQFLKADSTHYCSPFGGDGPSSVYANDTSGHDLDFTSCRFSGNTTWWMTQTLLNSNSTGTGPAHTLRARATELAPDCATGITGIFTIVGNLQFFDNKDLAHTPCKLTIGIAGLAGVAGTDYSQLQVNHTDCATFAGGLLTGLDNCNLVLNVKSGLNPVGLTLTVLTSDTTNFTGMRFANDVGGAGGWSDGHYMGTVTYNTNSVVLSNVALPEPATVALVGSGAFGLFGWLRRRRWK